MRNIHKNIRDLRIRKGLTQDELAQQLFVTRQTVSNYETGKSRPDIDMLMRIAEVLDTDINTVLYGVQPWDRQPLIRLAISCSLTLVMGILWVVVRDGFKLEYLSFKIGVMTWLYNISQPVFFALLGWTLAQGIAVLAKTKSPASASGCADFRINAHKKDGLSAVFFISDIPVLQTTSSSGRTAYRSCDRS